MIHNASTIAHIHKLDLSNTNGVHKARNKHLYVQFHYNVHNLTPHIQSYVHRTYMWYILFVYALGHRNKHTFTYKATHKLIFQCPKDNQMYVQSLVIA